MGILPLKYLGYGIAMQEVPDEISLVFNISGCPYKCEGCHSKYLWEYKGELLSENIDNIIDIYSGMITCVCFMGGDQNINEIESVLRHIKQLGLNTCLYTGNDDIKSLQPLTEYCDYIKCGRYIDSLKTDDNIQYGIKLATSNQRIYKRGMDY